MSSITDVAGRPFRSLHRRVKSLLSTEENTQENTQENVEEQSSPKEATSQECANMPIQSRLRLKLVSVEGCRTSDSSADPYHHLNQPAPSYMSTMGSEPPLRAGTEASRNRALSIRSNTNPKGGKNGPNSPPSRRPFSFQSLRGRMQPEMSRRMASIIKSMKDLAGGHINANKARSAVASDLVEWGQQTEDDAVADITDKIGVIWVGLGDQEAEYARELDDARVTLKIVRDTERSVQPSRDGKARIADQIQKLKIKDPENTRLVVLEQELVRAEAENLVAEAQLSNISRQKFKEAYAAEFDAVIARAERQLLLARHGHRLLELLDDSPMTPGGGHRHYGQANDARQVINDAEDDLRDYELDREAERRDDVSRPSSRGSSADSSRNSGKSLGDATAADNRRRSGSGSIEHKSHSVPPGPADV